MRFAGILAGVGVLAACSSGGAKGISIDDLTKASNTCPVRLSDAAAHSAQLTASASGSATAAASTAPPSDLSAPALARANGVEVDCSVTASNGDRVDLMLIASRVRGGAVGLLLPLLQRDGALTVAQLEGVATSGERTRPGRLVAVPGSSAVALAVVDVKGAKSAAFELSSQRLDRSHVEAIARDLAGKLS
jgi:hypothetical protein